ncbi:2'-5' RNA ligase family protein [Sinomonas sp. ASV322]|uniref:2'-5' RNA ligase family protein n=1 Tax=Sinomonas sp. ASV322 TaxID=3041920 RepID=UPI0027DCB4AB|nr:2'-5' RNA ligase family protein [Sinomonas sp. ASV322]MDQ4503462.1 2'-5' RNA ligase family protein [Sinomonas sp. ASV322]
MHRFAVVLPLAPMALGERYAVRDWPLHVTVTPVFATRATTPMLAARMGEVAAQHGPVDAVAGPPELFGPRHDTPVALLDCPEVRAMHAVLTDALAPFGIAFDSPGYSGEGFRPHVTATSKGAAAEGQKLWLAQLALVDMEPGPGPGRPQVVAVAALDARTPAVSTEGV